MRPIGQLLAELRQAKARVWADGDRLRYQAPKGALAPELLDELRARKPEVLEFCRAAQPETAVEALEPIPRDGDLLISLAQQRLWVLDRLEGPSATYNIALAFRCRGALDVDALRRSLAAIVDRHESLRTAFRAEGETVVQVIVPALSLPFSPVDLGHMPAEQRLPEVRRLAGEEALRPFDLSRAPLVRFVLWRLDGEDHVLLMNLHHIIGDGRSIEVLAEELEAFYGAYREGRGADLPELHIQYADFAWHQRQWLKDDVLQSQLAYWKRQLAGLPPLLDLPVDRPRPPVFTTGATVRGTLEAGLAARLKRLARESGTTPYLVFLAGVAVLLERYTGREDIAIGCPVTHRNRPELERLVGFFVDTLALRIDLSGNPSFRELLARTRAVAADGFAHQDAPFDKVVEAVGGARNPGYPPLVQFTVAMLDGRKTQVRLAGLDTEPFDFGNPIARYDISIEIYESDTAFDIFWIYNTGLFDADTVERMARHLKKVLEDATADAGKAASELKLLDEPERRKLLVQFNDTERPYPRQATIDELFEQQVEATPEAVAVQFGQRQMTYRELNRRAIQLARRLRALGVRPETTVAVSLERSLELPVALLGVLKAGGAFLPLAPEEPLERLDYVLNEVQPVVILSQEHLAELLPASWTYVLCMDAERDEIAMEREENLSRETTAEHLAYIMYTSGSTGRPKGVCVVHRGVVRLVLNTDYVDLRPDDRVAQASNASFDAATFEIWGALLNGARLVGVERDITLAPVEFAAFLREQQITTLFLTTALFNQMARYAPGAFATLRHLLFGGEQVDPQRVREVLRDGPPERLLHVYGPTENTTFSTWHLVEEVPEDAATVPIGKAIANSEIHVLDGNLQVLPVGVPGELYVGGDGLARGYLGQAGLTTERFVPNPFDQGHTRLYKTGDIVRRLPNGDIAFVGRRDNQVKIRGFRIELGELEAALSKHPALRMAVALAVGEGLERHLIAYVTPAAGAPTLAEARQFLRRRLPDYMLPAMLVALDELPLTPHGKVDRAALGRIQADPERVTPYEPPESDIEFQLAAIWKKVLGVDRVGRRDNFFGLGGHSLLATQLIARVQDVFGESLPIRLLFEEGTVAALAQVLEHSPQAARAVVAAKLRAHIDQLDPEQTQALLQQKRASLATSQTAEVSGSPHTKAETKSC